MFYSPLTGIFSIEVLSVACLCAFAQDIMIPPDNPAINYYGRFDFSTPKAPRFNWSGSTIEFQVDGTTAVGMELADGAGYYDIEIDGRIQSPVYAESWSSTKYTIATSLSSDSHVIRIIRRNEPYWAIATFSGIYLSDGGKIIPLKKPVRKMEFCGDSWTAGYFIEDCTDQQAHTNANKSWARLTSKAFKAQDVILAESGIGLVKSMGGKTCLPEKYGGIFDTMGDASTSAWDFSTWIPDIVSIFLGINDKSSGAADNEYIAAIHSFVKVIRGNYPSTPILFISYKDCMDRATESAVTEETSHLGHKDIYFYKCEQEVHGCSWHPDTVDAREIADSVINEIRRITGWDTVPPVSMRHHIPEPDTRTLRTHHVSRMITSTSNVITLPTTLSGSLKKVMIHDCLGRQISHLITENQKLTIPEAAGHSKGMYLITVDIM